MSHFPHLPTHPLRTLAVLAAVLLSAIAMAVGSAPAAFAHSELVASDPKDGSALQAAPATVTLTFGDAVIGEFTQIQLTRDGSPEPTVSAVSRDNVVTVSMPTGAGSGAYVVAYQVVSADSHPVSGQVSFTVAAAPSATPTAPSPSAVTDAPSASPTASASPTPSATAPGTSADSSTSWLGIGLILVLVVAAIVAAAVYASRRQSS